MTPGRTGLTLAAALLAGCFGSGDVAPVPSRAGTQLDDAGIRAIAQLLRHEDRRSYDPVLFERLADGGEEVRRRVATAAGRIGDAAAVPLLVRLLDDDPSPAVRADAAFALGELGDTSRVVMASLRAAVPPSWVPVRAEEADVAVEVVHALGKLGGFEARAMVTEALRDAHPGEYENARRVAGEALLSVWRFGDGPGRVHAVVRYLDVDNPELRWRATYALIRLGGAPEVSGIRPVRAPVQAAARLLDRLADDDHRARAAAARGLTPPVVDSAGIRDTARAALTAALADRHPHVRINAVRALGEYGQDIPVEAIIPLLNAAPHVAIAAAGALAGAPDRARDALARVMEDPARPFALRGAAATALAPADPDAVAGALNTWAGADFIGRYTAARALAALDTARAEPVLRRLVRDDDRRVAVAALRGLEPLVEEAELEGLRAAAGLEEPEREPPEPTREFYEEMVRAYVAAPLAGGPRPRAVIRTRAGEIELELLAEEAPLTVHNFVTLARDGFWDAGVWHRVIPNFVLQDGAPAGDPEGGPGWRIRDEINRVRYHRGVLGMALAGPDTGGSQWFITHSPQHHLDGGYTIFGRVVRGMDVADAVLQGDPIESIRVLR